MFTQRLKAVVSLSQLDRKENPVYLSILET